MLTETRPESPTTPKHRELVHHRPKDPDRHSNDLGEAILFVMLIGIILALAVIMNHALSETFAFIRNALSL